MPTESRPIEDDDVIVLALPAWLYCELWRELKHDRQMLVLEHHAVNWRDYRAARVNTHADD